MKGLEAVKASREGRTPTITTYAHSMRGRLGEREAALPGGGLQAVKTMTTPHPAAEISDQKVEITDRELQGFTVQIVSQQIEKESYALT